uniref:Uncharacterized protein n=1 Tax=Globisporangium ultimum (strain ATCC 200006 / CBS 805.95 / DAOM BR144) TaxID=431595 RepID=K3WL36_GLOUD
EERGDGRRGCLREGSNLKNVSQADDKAINKAEQSYLVLVLDCWYFSRSCSIWMRFNGSRNAAASTSSVSTYTRIWSANL